MCKWVTVRRKRLVVMTARSCNRGEKVDNCHNLRVSAIEAIALVWLVAKLSLICLSEIRTEDKPE